MHLIIPSLALLLSGVISAAPEVAIRNAVTTTVTAHTTTTTCAAAPARAAATTCSTLTGAQIVTIIADLNQNIIDVTNALSLVNTETTDGTNLVDQLNEIIASLTALLKVVKS